GRGGRDGRGLPARARAIRDRARARGAGARPGPVPGGVEVPVSALGRLSGAGRRRRRRRVRPERDAGPRRARAMRRRRGARPLRPAVLLSLIAVLVVLGGGWWWFRDSSLVAVSRVTVLGASGPDAGKIRQALEVSARGMTTLDVSMSQLRTAVSPYPVVKDLSVSTQFPHGMRITVIEQRPVGAITLGGHRIAVAADGTLLPNVVAPESLPAIPVRALPGGSRVTHSGTRAQVALLGAAPYELLTRISQV